ncbi:MAG TPA: AAA family ATPase [bacterium]|nr:AAA family ATPase [bacterium]HPP88470.1 AAA family ATPase [bacterium]
MNIIKYKNYEKIKDGAKSMEDRIFITGVSQITLDSITNGFNIAMNITLEPEFNSMPENAETDRMLPRGKGIIARKIFAQICNGHS